MPLKQWTPRGFSASTAPLDLGVKGKAGILKNVQSRRALLLNTEHRVRFVYTPKHCSWLNQVEVWFSILSRRALMYRLALGAGIRPTLIAGFCS